MVSKLLTWIGKVLNWSPILHVSSDSDFGSFDGSKDDFRLSLLTLSLGQNKYYFISASFNNNEWRVNIFHNLDFFNVCPISTEKEIEMKNSAYIDSFNDRAEETDEIVKRHIELLKEKITQNRTRISNSFTKLTGYRSLVLALSGAGVYLLTEILKSRAIDMYLGISSTFLLLFILYGLSAFLQITFALKIKAFVKSSFKEFKDNPTSIELAKSFYTDFVSLNNESQIIVSITKNAEKYFNRSFIVLILAWFWLFFHQNTFSINEAIFLPTENEFVVMGKEQKLQTEQMSAFFSSLAKYQGTIYVVSNTSNQKVETLTLFIQSILTENQKLSPILLKNDYLDNDVIILKLGE